jgi:hypothetical protein
MMVKLRALNITSKLNAKVFSISSVNDHSFGIKNIWLKYQTNFVVQVFIFHNINKVQAG